MKRAQTTPVMEQYTAALKNIPYKKVLHYFCAGAAAVLLVFHSLIVHLSPHLEDKAGWTSQMPIWWILSGIAVLYLASLLYRILTWSGLFRFVLVYLLYLLVSYGVYLGIHVNNPTIDPWAYLENGFYQISTLWLMVVLFFLAYSFRFSYRLERSIQDHLPQLNETFLYSLFLTICVLNDHLILNALMKELETHFSLQTFLFIRELESVLWLPLCLVVVVTLFATASIKDFWHNRSSLSSAVWTSLVLAVVFNYTIQLGVQGKEQLLGKYIFAGAVSYQILILTLVSLLVYLLFNRFILATFTNIALWSLISIVNTIKESMRSEPLLITDFIWLTKANTVAGFVEGEMISQLVLYLTGLAFVMVFLHFTVLKGKIIAQWKHRLLALVALLSVLGTIYSVFLSSQQNKVPENIPILSELNNKDDVTWFGFSTNARYKSLMYVWTKQLTKKTMEKPDGYSKEKIKEIVEKYSTVATDINQSRIGNLSEQTVVFVLSESFSNPEYVPNVHLSRDVMPNIKEIKAQTTSGIMKSDGYGGGTANMEFQALSGLPFRNFSPSVSIAYIEVVPKMDYFPSISHHFSPENRFVIHPASAKNYNRNIVYNDLAFGTFIAHHDGDKYFTSPVPVGALIGDWTAYSTVLENIQQEQSQFFSVITMQNHSPWLSDEPADILASGVGYSDEENEKLTNYARLLSYTDEATKAFLDRLSELDKKVTVVFYGDHLPGLYPSFAFSERPEAQFQTDYFIWSNKENQKLEHPYLNSSDFTAALFEHTNAKVSPYIALLTEMMRKASVDQVELTEEGKVVAADMYLLQYDLTV
ncbi:TPA: LTA synthase family protein, partial [Streptococcus suis]